MITNFKICDHKYVDIFVDIYKPDPIPIPEPRPDPDQSPIKPRTPNPEHIGFDICEYKPDTSPIVHLPTPTPINPDPEL